MADLQAAFLRSIIEAPDDDGPRLVFADWLEERGDPRASFIRLQCEADQLCRHDATAGVRLYRHSLKVAQQHQARWLGPLRRPGISSWFVRGLVHLKVWAKWLAAREQQALVGSEWWAWVESVQIKRPARTLVPALASSPLMASVAAFSLLPGGLGPSDLQALTNSPQLDGLHRLHLNGACSGDAAAALSTSAGLRQLRELGIWSGNVKPAGLEAFMHSHLAARLRGLEIGDGFPGSDGIGVLGAEALAASPNLLGLRSLRLFDYSVKTTGIEALASSPRIAGLNTLALHCGVGTEGVRALAASPHLSRLGSLDLAQNGIGDKGAQALAKAGGFRGLACLDLSTNRIGQRGAIALANSPLLGQLSSLTLNINEIGDRGVIALAGAPHVCNLITLAITQNGITDVGVKALGASPSLAGLKHLNLLFNRIGDVGARSLAGSPFLTGLVSLNLQYNPISSVGRRVLRTRFGARLIM
ncbi:MAG TPA: TIGR02996 domain-containing protein [Gemmataceae bacterium]|jgi:uncharacterized protein (TIGR02996 family)